MSLSDRRAASGNATFETADDAVINSAETNSAEILFAVQQESLGDGTASFSGSSSSPYTFPGDCPSVGSLGVMVDAALGWAMISSLPPDSWTLSTDIGVDMVGPIPKDGSRLRTEARTLSTGSFTTGRVLAEDGTVLAQCRQRGREVADVPAVDYQPELSEVPGSATDLFDVLNLIEDGTDLALSVDSRHVNPRFTLHGGVSLCASEVAAVRDRLTQGSQLLTSSVHIAHLRGIPEGAHVRFVPTTRHAGRTLWVTDVAGLVDDRLCTLTRVTAET